MSGPRADADLMIWWHAETSDQLQEAYNLFRRHPRLGRARSRSGRTWRCTAPPSSTARTSRRSSPTRRRNDASVYPFVRSDHLYLLPDEDRRRMLADHGKMARGYPDARDTVASFSLGDYEWMLAFEADELYRIVDLMRHLRASEARMHVREEVPFSHRPP